jgi:phenylpropionate dioxygenase-like ring-hydroxylating dioxygenase large terminal subunit/uncharacterized membrane protein
MKCNNIVNVGRRGSTFVVSFLVLWDLFLQSHHTPLQAEGFAVQQKVVPFSRIGKKTARSRTTHLLQLAATWNTRLPLQSDEGTPSAVVKGQQHDQQPPPIPQPFTESVSRSAIKTLLWKILSAAVTWQTTMIFTGRFRDALNMLAVSFLPKFATLFVMDRLVNRGARSVTSKLQRSLIKVVAWRTLSLAINVVSATLILRDYTKASKIASVDFVSKTVLLLLYEQLWNQIGWGTTLSAIEETAPLDETGISSSSSQSQPQKNSATASTISAAPTSTSLHMTVAASEDDKTLQTHDTLPTEEESFFSWENQWFPVMPKSYLEGLDSSKPVAVSILGRNLVVWKSSSSTTGSNATDQWAVFEDTCPHRRSPLSTGQVVAGCLTCRYHGWEFGADGKVARFPMQLPSDQNANSLPKKIQANSFPSQIAGGLLWVFLGKDDDGAEKIPVLPPEAIPTEHETTGAEWMFNRNPISYISMMENTFDPAHSPWTHEQMVGFGGMAFSPTDIIPMKRYNVLTQPTIRGFSLEHTPYQNSTAQVAGHDSLTIRTFVPPCTVKVASPPFFQTKMWFVPASSYETNLLSFFQTPETRLVKWTRRFPRLQEFVKDTQHTLQYLGDWNYRFLSQDRITMQGQDMRKVGKSLKDLTPNLSDNGVATFQEWLQTVGGGGPFAAASLANGIDNKEHFFSRELSFWEGHGKYCPRCQRSMNRLSSATQWTAKLSSRLMVATIVSGLFAGVTSLMTTSSGRLTRVLLVLTINLLVSHMGSRQVVDWCRRIEKRMHGVGADLWPPHESVFGYRGKQF